jgi:hypothetical protein
VTTKIGVTRILLFRIEPNIFQQIIDLQLNLIHEHLVSTLKDARVINQSKCSSVLLLSSDEFELKFPALSRAGKVASQAELGHLNFRAETELTFMYINKKQIFTTC